QLGQAVTKGWNALSLMAQQSRQRARAWPQADLLLKTERLAVYGDQICEVPAKQLISQQRPRVLHGLSRRGQALLHACQQLGKGNGGWPALEQFQERRFE